MSLNSVLSTFTIASIYAILGFGVFISFKILNFTDLTVEAAFGFGGAISAMMCRKEAYQVLENAMGHWSIYLLPYLSLICAFIGGCAAGIITGLLHTKLKINSVLSGILTLTAFYTINILVCTKGSSVLTSIGLSGKKGVTLFPSAPGWKMLIMFVITALIGVGLAFFFKTRLGLSIRACGDNEQMTKTQCISTDFMKIFGLALSNGLVALSGALFVQSEANYSSRIETGMMVIGVATIIIGEILILRKHDINLMLLGIFVGSVIYRFIYAFALRIPSIKANYLHVITASLIVIIMFASKMYSDLRSKKHRKEVASSLLLEEQDLALMTSQEETKDDNN